LKVPYCSLFIFSTENWRRPKDEVEFLLRLLVDWAKEDRMELIDRGVKVLPVGRWRELPAPVPSSIARVAEETKGGKNLTIMACVNYGGRQEIVDAARSMAKDLAGYPKRVENLDIEGFARYLYAPGIPDPDLIVRTSGEERLSNFLLWQAAYSEFVFTDVLWPDITPADVYKAVVEYGGRARRFGDVSEKGG